MLETLGPAERAVFVLREIFGLSYHEVATALERSPAAVRQVAHRAREHVQARRPRFTAGPDEQRRVTAALLQACTNGDPATLIKLLAPDVRLVSDSGGRAKAARRPVLGADKGGPLHARPRTRRRPLGRAARGGGRSDHHDVHPDQPG